MVLIYIRHGHDYTRSHDHDERLSDIGKKESYKIALELIQEHGIPDIIYHSPYYRARQTAKLMVKAIKKTNNIKVERDLDPRLGRYFTRKQKKNPDIKRSTGKKGAIIHEDWSEFKERVGEQLIDHTKRSKKQNIWCITHNLVIRRVCKLKDIVRESKWVDYLEVLKIE